MNTYVSGFDSSYIYFFFFYCCYSFKVLRYAYALWWPCNPFGAHVESKNRKLDIIPITVIIFEYYRVNLNHQRKSKCLDTIIMRLRFTRFE